jgi:hypothetical protein
MTIATVKNWARVLIRANIPGFIMGGHGLGKTSAIYQLYLEGCQEFGVKPLSLAAIHETIVHGRSHTGDSAQLHLDTSALSSIDGKKLARSYQDPDTYGFWSVSAANITTEEMIGMPDVEDRDAIYRQLFLDTLQAASRLSTMETINENHEHLFAYACGKLGVTEADKGRRVLRYLRLNALMPDPAHRAGGIWLIDELNLGFPEVEKALMQILLERRYLDYVLPDNIWVVTTMNPPCPSYPGARELGLPTLDRGALITIDPDKDEWLKWAARRGLSEASRMFVDKNDRILNPVKEEIKLDEFRNPATYRSVEWADRAYAVMSEKEIKDVGLVVATSLLGPEVATIYHREYTETTHRPLSLEDVIDDYGWRPTMSRDEEKDYKSWKVTKSRTRLRAMIQKANVKSELIRYTLTELAAWVDKLDKDLEKRGSTKTEPKHTDAERGQILNMMLFLHDLPIDIARGFMLQDVDERFARLMYWTGSYPVTRSFYDRVETEYQQAVGTGDDNG